MNSYDVDRDRCYVCLRAQQEARYVLSALWERSASQLGALGPDNWARGAVWDRFVLDCVSVMASPARGGYVGSKEELASELASFLPFGLGARSERERIYKAWERLRSRGRLGEVSPGVWTVREPPPPTEPRLLSFQVGCAGIFGGLVVRIACEALHVCHPLLF